MNTPSKSRQSVVVATYQSLTLNLLLTVFLWKRPSRVLLEVLDVADGQGIVAGELSNCIH